MNRHTALYRRMLLLYPARFRQGYGEEMVQLFADLLADQRRQPLGIFRLWLHTIIDSVFTASKERMEEESMNNTALTRALLLAVPIAVAGLYFAGLAHLALLVLIAGVPVLIARRRSLPNALVGPRGGRWWVWTLAGLAMIASAAIFSTLANEALGELGWMLFSLLFLAGILIVGASIVRALALLLTRPSTGTHRG